VPVAKDLPQHPSPNPFRWRDDLAVATGVPKYDMFATLRCLFRKMTICSSKDSSPHFTARRQLRFRIRGVATILRASWFIVDTISFASLGHPVLASVLPHRWPPIPRLGIMRLHQRAQLAPRHHLLHLLQKYRSPRLPRVLLKASHHRSTSTLTAGTHGSTAVYSGDGTFKGSTSPALEQVVN
jgi:hypothetical protein